MAVKTPNGQYIGARYVPKVFKNPDDGSAYWKANTEYEALTIVVVSSGDSYTSRQAVPRSIGSPEDNPNYWTKTGDFNASLLALQNRVSNIERQNGSEALETDAQTLSGAVNELLTDAQTLSGAVNELLEDIEIYASSKHNILYYGAKANDETFSNSNAIAEAIEANKGSYIYIPSGTFYIDAPIENYRDNDNWTDIYMHESTIIRAISPIDYLIHLGALGEHDWRGGSRKKIVKGGTLNAFSNVNIAALYIDQDTFDIDVSYMNINKYGKIGIKIGDSATKSTDTYIHHVNIKNTGEAGGTEYTGVGIQINTNDNSISHCRIYQNLIEVESVGSSIYINDVHTLAIPDNIHTSIAFKIYGSIFIDNSYADGNDIMADIQTDYISVAVSNTTYYTYTDNKLTAFKLNNHPTAFMVTNFLMVCSNSSVKNVGIDMPSFGASKTLQEFSNKQKLQFKNVNLTNAHRMRDGDALKTFCRTDNQLPIITTLLEKDKWYKLGSVQTASTFLRERITIRTNGSRWNEFGLDSILNSDGSYGYDLGQGIVDGHDTATYKLGISTDVNDEYGIISYYLMIPDSTWRQVTGVIFNCELGNSLVRESTDYSQLTPMDDSFNPIQTFTISNNTIVADT